MKTSKYLAMRSILFNVFCLTSLLIISLSCSDEQIITETPQIEADPDLIQTITESLPVNPLYIDSLLSVQSSRAKNARASSEFIATILQDKRSPSEFIITVVSSTVDFNPATEFVTYTAKIYENGLTVTTNFANSASVRVVKQSGTFNYTGSVSYKVQRYSDLQTVRSGSTNAGPISIKFAPNLPSLNTGEILGTPFSFCRYFNFDGDKIGPSIGGWDVNYISGAYYRWSLPSTMKAKTKIEGIGQSVITAGPTDNAPSSFTATISVTVSKPGFTTVTKTRVLTINNCTKYVYD